MRKAVQKSATPPDPLLLVGGETSVFIRVKGAICAVLRSAESHHSAFFDPLRPLQTAPEYGRRPVDRIFPRRSSLGFRLESLQNNLTIRPFFPPVGVG